jgi:nucleoside-diphosphate-sugar epimerase
VAFVGHGDPSEFYSVNVIGTRNLLEAIAASAGSVTRVILASSANIYGNSTEGRLSEDTPANPANDYSVSKWAMEELAKLWRDQLPITVTRPFNYTGVGQAERFLVPKIVKHFLGKEPVIELGNLDVWRDFSDVRDIALIYRRLAESSGANSTVNLCSGKTQSLRSVLEKAAEITGHQIEVLVNPRYVRKNDVKALSGSTNNLHSLIGEFQRISLDETLEWMLSQSR